METDLTISKIEKMIYIIRGQKVMLDSDLAELYGVETKRLIEQVKRNSERFPQDFMFECDSSDLEEMRSQFATASRISTWNYKRSSFPMLFTEIGVAMLSSVLNSSAAIQVNISIIRIFVRHRSFLLMEQSNLKKIDQLETGTNKLFKSVFERLDSLEESTPRIKPDRKKIGLKKE